ncbi:hypothetical protein F9K90_07620 [Brucella anthropi]|uniref:hypothetical protein n=1 Tax=Brucella anthropi TaxID=529 RepID=UPI00124C2EB3|nr:hypothetical protein [Brucella anthropi]KAB2738540.1 hypothetical protein F9K90_07620 [Brucella anthropi]
MMKKIEIHVDDLTQIVKLLPSISENGDYTNGILTVPDDVSAEVTAILADASWRDQALVTLKQELKTGIDSAAETERLKYITPGNGQAMTYQQKVAEAQAFKAASNPKTSDYPILSSEVGITAETIGEVADVVLAAFAQWQQIGAMIESIRLGAKRDIDLAEDEAAAQAIVEAIEWPQPAL